ncbi:hypothetical protein [Bacillus testis]|uniref:hypothetical protein n=1 Tax=Bacillus testis TaxID=1622072 RepID=UPI00067F3F3E|nr:hypothetical protein [Bacillus testis]
MKATLDGFSQRMKRLNPLFHLGKGMEVGNLKPKIQSILMQVLLEIFYRELNDDDQRQKTDIRLIIQEVVDMMGLSADSKTIDRMVSGLLYRGKEEEMKPFEAEYYNEMTQTWDTQTFRYVTMDDLHTDLEKGQRTVYKLTDVAQEMIFMSREMAEEFSISIEQLYSMQLIKNGNFKKATDNLDLLISRVKRLIKGEQAFQKEMKENPKILVLEQERQREDHKDAIESQFEEEKKHFRTIMTLLERAKNKEDYSKVKAELFFLQDRFEHARQLHDHFAKLVIENISIELRLKVERPSLFWESSFISFKEHYYEGWFMKQGVEDFSLVEKILGPLFSPRNEFILPLDWVWGEQEYEALAEQADFGDEEIEEEEEYRLKVTDWQSVVGAWTYVFDHLKEFGEFSLSSLADLPYEAQDQWFEESETLDMWMMFDRKPLVIAVYGKEEELLHDEREVLISKLMAANPEFSYFEGKQIYTKVEEDKSAITWYHTKISPFKLCIKENDQ